MNDKSIETRLKEGAGKLSRMQAAALNDVANARHQIKEMRKQWAEHETKVLIPAEKNIKLQTAIVFDELCEAHGMDRNGREVIPSKDLATFTLGEASETEVHEESTLGSKAERKPLILGADGHAARTGPLKLAGSIRPVDGIVTPEDAASILDAVGAGND